MKNLAPLAAVLEDLRRARPDLSTALHADYRRCVNLVSTRGISVVMIDFPAACKKLDAALSGEWLDVGDLPSTFGVRDLDHSNWLFGCLFRELFHEDGLIKESIDLNCLFFLRQLLLLYKKVDIPCPPKAVDLAIDDFVQIESQMRRPTGQWHLCDGIDTGAPEETDFLDDFDTGPLLKHEAQNHHASKGLIRTLQSVCDIVVSKLPYPDPLDFKPRHGPGAVCDQRSGADKYLFPTWPAKLNRIFEKETFAYSSTWIGLTDALIHSESEPPARLIAVPKTLKSPRLIASEPVSHQWMQQATMRWMRENTPHPLQLCFNPMSQEPSRASALLNSQSGECVTFDLSSASDRLSCWVVERALRNAPYFLSVLHAVRTRTVLVKYSSETRGRRILLKKYANQGSAVTFMLQSWIYSLICISAVLFAERRKPTAKNITRAASSIRVFGDDLIIPKVGWYDLCNLLDYLGLKVNGSKTHLSGKFRESCGMDAYDGNDVSPVYLTSLTTVKGYESLSSCVDVSNNAYIKGLWSLSSVIQSMIDDNTRRMIPITPEPSGPISLRTFQRQSYVAHMRGRWNTYLQHAEIRSVSYKIVKAKGERSSSQGLLQFFTESQEVTSPLDFMSPLTWTYGRSLQQRIKLTVRWVAGHPS